MRDVNCPYCGKEIDINHDDGYGYQENIIYQEWCSSCQKYFGYTTTVTFSYDVHKAECMNDGNHEWQMTDTTPQYFTVMECPNCGIERPLTEEERIANKVPSREDYLKSIENFL
jgi:endogenous inhibitor of DNA gyrase (YacG/DUF329 family)